MDGRHEGAAAGILSRKPAATAMTTSNIQIEDNVDDEPMASDEMAKLHLPASCDPPGPGNPAKQLVWIVSDHHLLFELLSST